MPSSTVNAIHWDNQTMLSVQGTGEMRSSISNFKVKKKLIIRAHFICRKSIFNQSHRKIISSLSWNSFRYFSETFSFISVSIGERESEGTFRLWPVYRWSVLSLIARNVKETRALARTAFEEFSFKRTRSRTAAKRFMQTEARVSLR